MADRPLTAKQEAFCEEYLVDLNGTQAAIRAKYSKKTAKQIATENLSKPAIQTKIVDLKAARALRTQLNSDYVLKRLHQIESLDLDLCFDENGHLLPINAMPEVIRRSIGGVDVTTSITKIAEDISVEELTKKLKIENRTKALELMGKHVDIKAFENPLDIELPEGVEFHFHMGKK